MSAASPRFIVLCADKKRSKRLSDRVVDCAEGAETIAAFNVDEAVSLMKGGEVLACVFCLKTMFDHLAEYHDVLRISAPEHVIPTLGIHSPDFPASHRDRVFKIGIDDLVASDASRAEYRTKLDNLIHLSGGVPAPAGSSERLTQMLGARSRELQYSTERFRALLDATDDMVLIVEASTTEHRVVEANPVAVDRFDTGLDHILGEPLISFLAPESVGLLRTNMLMLPGSRETEFDLMFQTPSASRFTCLIHARAIQHANQPMVLLLGTRYRADTQPKSPVDESGRFRMMASRTGQVVYELDVASLRITLGGALQELVGYTRQEMEMYQEGRWFYLLHPDDRKDVLGEFKRVVESVGKGQLEYRVRRKDGSYRHVEDTFVCIPGRDGKAIRTVGTLKDITHRVESEESRRRAHEAGVHSQKLESLGVLAGGIAHDFNNILAAIIGLTALALRDVEEGTPLHEDLSEVLQAGNRAKDLVRQILTFSRQQDSEHVPVQLPLVAGEVLKLIRATAPPNIRFVSHADSDLGPIMANPAQIHQILMNLCTNAQQALSKEENGGSVQVVVERLELGTNAPNVHPRLTPGTWVRVALIDDGHGMNEHVRQRVFDPFFTTKRPGEGTGMGLAVVHGIVSEHRGVIEVKSKPGEGTTFYVYFPMVEEAAFVPEADEQVAPEGVERVLVLVPERMVAHFVTSTLDRLGYSVTDTETATDALRNLNAGRRYDAIVVDTRLPDATPEQFCKSVQEAAPGLPVLFLTGTEESEFVQALSDEGSVQSLRKPMGFEELARATRRVVDISVTEQSAGN